MTKCNIWTAARKVYQLYVGLTEMTKICCILHIIAIRYFDAISLGPYHIRYDQLSLD